MKRLIEYIDEGLLRGMEETLANGEADLEAIERAEIEKKLLDENKYFIQPYRKNTKGYDIVKVDGKWIINVHGYLRVFGIEEAITDGSFEFGIINGDFHLSCGWDNKKLKSLKYGPKEVTGNFMILWGDVIKNLQYCPKYVGGTVEIGAAGITTLKWFPEEVGNNVRIYDCAKLKDFKGLRKCKIMGYLRVMHNLARTSPDVVEEIYKKWDVNNKKESKFDNI